MKKLLKIYQDAPPFGKILLIAAVILLAYLIYKGISKALKPAPANEGQIDSAGDEIKALQESGQITHYTQSQINGFADKLFQAMDGQGTNEDQIKEVMNYMQNKADVLELIKAFGVRDYEDGFFLVYQYNLTQWLNEEMDEADIKEFVNDVLKAKGIDYSF